MEPAKIDWKNIESRFIVDVLYEHINAPKWVDFSASEEYVDDEAWFCKPDCRHPKTAEEFLRSGPSPKLKHLSSVTISDILPLGEQNRRDANLKRRGLISASNPSIHDPKIEKSTKSRPPRKFHEDSENENPNISTPQNHQSKIMKEAIKSSAEKKKPLDNSPCPADSSQNDRKPQLKSTLSAHNLFAGREILNQVTEFCNELKKLAMRAKVRENSETSNVNKTPMEANKVSPEKFCGHESQKEKEKKPLLEMEKGSSEAMEKSNGKEKQRRLKRSEETENIPISVDLKNVRRGENLLQVRTCPPSPQCFSAPPKPSKSKPMSQQERGILQEVEQNNKAIKEEELGDKGNATTNRSVFSAAADTEAKSLDVFWFLKPCTFLSKNN